MENGITIDVSKNIARKEVSKGFVVELAIDENVGIEGMEDGHEGPGQPVARIDRDDGHLELVPLWLPERDDGWRGTLQGKSFRKTILPNLPYVQLYADGDITIGDTCLVDSVRPNDSNYAAVRAYVDGALEPVRRELEAALSRLKSF